MADNYLITGYWGEPHVTAENDRGINAAIFGAGRFVLPVGNQFRAEYIGNNTIRVYDGKLIDNGAVAGIPAGQYVDLLVPETGQGLNRNDLIVFQYEKDASTLVESGIFAVVNGVETEEMATDPELTQEDILSDTATFDQMALWRVSVAGSVISAPVPVFKVAKNMEKVNEEKIVAATSTNGVNYEATVEDVEELYTGLELTIIPNMTSTSTAVYLNVNELGEKRIRLPVSSSASATTTPQYKDFYAAGKPVKLIYDESSLNGVWRIVDKQRPAGTDIYGEVPIENGGTGADNAPDAVKNLNIYPIGSIYMSTVDVSPAALFGGSWERIQDTFLLAAGSAYSAGSKGGNDTYTIDYANLPQGSLQVFKNQNSGSVYVSGTKYLALTAQSSEYIITERMEAGKLGHNSSSSQPIDNKPPYLAVYMWKRTA